MTACALMAACAEPTVSGAAGRDVVFGTGPGMGEPGDTGVTRGPSSHPTESESGPGAEADADVATDWAEGPDATEPTNVATSDQGDAHAGPGADVHKSEVIVGCVPQEISTRYDATWIFGHGCRADWDQTNALRFTTTGVYFTGFEGTITAADPATGALFATSDGIDLYDGAGTKTNPKPLGATVTTSQAVAFIGRPRSASDFYVVANGASENGVGGLFVTTLPCGSAVPTAEPALVPGTDAFTEALATVRHSNDVDRWVVSASPEGVAAVPVTADGFGAPVISPWNGALVGVGPAQRASIVFARDRHTFALTAEGVGLVVGSFDAASGYASDLVPVPLPSQGSLYSAAFSPDQSKLYVSEWTGRFWQVDRAAGNLVTDLGSATGALRLAIDDRVYLAGTGANVLAVITNPDAPAAALALETAQLPEGCTSSYGFPGVGDL